MIGYFLMMEKMYLDNPNISHNYGYQPRKIEIKY